MAIVLMQFSIALGMLPAMRQLFHVARTELQMPDNFKTYGICAGLLQFCISFGIFTGTAMGGVLLEAFGFAWATFIPCMMIWAGSIVVIVYIIIVNRRRYVDLRRNKFIEI